MIVRPNFLTYYLARGGEAGTLSVPRIQDGTVLWRGEQAHRGLITNLVWSYDGQILASGGQDGIVRVWQANTGDLLHSFSHGEQVQRLRWSPQGMLASASGTTIHVWSLATATSALS